MKHIITNILIITLLAACQAQNRWVVDSITTGNFSFDSSRLRFISSQRIPPLTFEMYRMGDQMEAFLSLSRPLSTPSVPFLFTIEGEAVEMNLPIHEGRMRLRLPQEATAKIILCLQEGKKVAICLDGYEEILEPSQFAGSYGKFMGKTSFLQNLIKVPL